MVGAINPPQSGSNTYAAYVANAKAFTGSTGVCTVYFARMYKISYAIG
jgi:hypothetical protein